MKLLFSRLLFHFSFVFYASLWSTSLLRHCNAGEEVLAGFQLEPDDLKPSDIGIVQFDNRPLRGYWNISAHWNYAYALHHGHRYAYLSMHGECFDSTGQFTLAPAWCKVKAMLAAPTVLPMVKAYLFLDSDAVVTSNHSLADIIGFIRKDLNWDLRNQPLAFNQDGPGWSCKYTMNLGVDYCLNSGTVFWLRGAKNPLVKGGTVKASHRESPGVAERILREWWESASADYHSSLFPTKWRRRWPWEQAQMYIIFDKNRDAIMRLSFPNNSFLPWTSKKNPKSQYPTDKVDPWCFSHWPGADCFITHFCASKNQKRRIKEYYSLDSNVGDIKVAVHDLDRYI